MGFSRQEYWSGLLWPPPGDLPDPGIKPLSLMFPALAGGFFTTSATKLSTALLTREGSELKHKLTPLMVRSVLAEMNQRRWWYQKVSPFLRTQSL